MRAFGSPVVSVVLLLALAGCTRTNPIFGASGGGTDGADSGGLGTDTSGVGSLSGSASASASASDTSGDPTTDPTTDATTNASDTGETTGGDAVCGNGVQESGEECDLGPGNGPTKACQLDCTGNECGDGHVGPGQPCDDGPNGSVVCSPECKPLSCGDGVVQGDNGEECEPVLEPTCTPVCTHNVCGDSYPLESEQCDDGNADNTDNCVEGCMAAFCGDGFVHGGVEQCDDENENNQDSCLNNCVYNTCGDGFIDPSNEDCDGNLEQTCTELGFDGGTPTCTNACAIGGCTLCGDGMVEGEEECEPDLMMVVACTEFGLEGMGTVSCQDDCTYTVSSGDCCAPEGDPCEGLAACCGECDPKTQLCLMG